MREFSFVCGMWRSHRIASHACSRGFTEERISVQGGFGEGDNVLESVEDAWLNREFEGGRLKELDLMDDGTQFAHLGKVDRAVGQEMCRGIVDKGEIPQIHSKVWKTRRLQGVEMTSVRGKV